MKEKLFLSVLIGVMLIGFAAPAMAEEKQTLRDESIYDLLVDRFFNKGIQNDYEVNSQDKNAFNGGDFQGLTSEMQYIKDMGFTLVSLGPVFSTATYDGKQVLDYGQLERHFGTKEEFQETIAKIHELDMKLMVDIPTQRLSGDHVWKKENPDWFIANEDGTFALDTANPKVQGQLIKSITEFVNEYQVDGLRFQTADKLDPAFIERFSKDIKQIRDIYILSDDRTQATPGLDAVIGEGIEKALRDSYKTFNPTTPPSTGITQETAESLIQVDSLLTSRFTSDVVEERGYPPTRWNLLMFQMLTMPGIPVVQYGSEIAANGKAIPESHPILDLGVDKELVDHITNLNSLRNSSEALRVGNMEVLIDKDGWLVYKRSNDEEAWIVAINNTSSTKSLSLSAEVIGENKELKGMFENSIIRQDDTGAYKVTLDRELGETFFVTEKKGLNKAYIAALVVLYVTFLSFLWFAWRRGKKRRAGTN